MTLRAQLWQKSLILGAYLIILIFDMLQCIEMICLG